MVSAEFWPQLQFIEAPFCKTCGIPFSFGIEEGALCAACMEREPAFDGARAAVVYNDASRQLVLGFKYGDRLHAIHTFVPWMIRCGRDLIDAADIIIPVPLHHKRLRARMFNQSALLAQEIGKRVQKTYIPDALRRIRPTLPQKGLSAKERLKNVQGAFAVNGNVSLRNKNILLVDDVFTSGATLNECAKVLKEAGADRINVLTIAKVTREEF
jgi:ComF family protein